MPLTRRDFVRTLFAASQTALAGKLLTTSAQADDAFTGARNFAVIGDRGVHERCGDSFWTELTGAMVGYFKRGEFTEGVVHGVERAGALLAAHFPPA